MSIKEILAHKGSDVLYIRAGALVKAAAGEMRQHNVASLVVKQNDRIVGILSGTTSSMRSRNRETAHCRCPSRVFSRAF